MKLVLSSSMICLLIYGVKETIQNLVLHTILTLFLFYKSLKFRAFISRYTCLQGLTASRATKRGSGPGRSLSGFNRVLNCEVSWRRNYILSAVCSTSSFVMSLPCVAPSSSSLPQSVTWDRTYVWVNDNQVLLLLSSCKTQKRKKILESNLSGISGLTQCHTSGVIKMIFYSESTINILQQLWA